MYIKIEIQRIKIIHMYAMGHLSAELYCFGISTGQLFSAGIPFLLQSVLCQFQEETARLFSKIITELAKPHTYIIWN